MTPEQRAELTEAIIDAEDGIACLAHSMRRALEQVMRAELPPREAGYRLTTVQYMDCARSEWNQAWNAVWKAHNLSQKCGMIRAEAAKR